MSPPIRRGIRGALSDYDSLVELGVGRRTEVAESLAAAGKRVVAVDVREFPVPDGVQFVRDDLFAAAERSDPGEQYRAEALYACNLPPELHRPARTVARRVGADLLFTTLGGDEPSIPVARRTVADDTLYVVPADAAGRPRERE